MRMALFSLVMMPLAFGCGENGKSNDDISGDDSSSDLDTDAAFELIGSWQYTGGYAGLTNTLTVTADQMVDTGNFNATGWNITFNINSWDNTTDQAEVEVVEVEGYSHHPVGSSLYFSWRLEDDTMKLYTSTTDYVTPSGGEEGDDFVTYTRSD